MSAGNKKRAIIFRVFTLIALAFIVGAALSPLWWVALKAPQYPPAAFPDGIRIHFHIDSVQNGCKKQERTEVVEEESLNCKHEMDAINHYVGMYPISSGGPVERALSPFAMSLLAVMLLAFIMPGRKSQITVFIVGAILITAWMNVAYHSKGGVKYLSPSYVDDMVETMDLYPEDYEDWTAKDAIKEVYTESLGRYFREKDVIEKRVGMMMKMADIVYYGIMAGIVALALGLIFIPFTYWFLALIPAMLPVFFVLEYSAWLWWFGHNMNEMGAFSLKPFMPTVLGQGKVAQFSTYSYPHEGFFMLLVASFFLILALLIRKRQLR